MTDRGGGPIRSFGRRKGRKLRPRREWLLSERLPALAISARLDQPAGLAPSALFEDRVVAVWLEIGFGGGEHLAWQAAAHPEIGFIGCEPFVNGIGALLAAIEQESLRNVRIHGDDARPLLGALADASIERCFILFPDPWPKHRHHKRRLFAEPMVAALGRVLADGAELRVATDDPNYLAAILALFLSAPEFEWIARGPADWRTRPTDWPATRYEMKARAAGRTPIFLRFRRRPRGPAGPRHP
jgi:tRNA (guanine-N7-)-methyltransferase